MKGSVAVNATATRTIAVAPRDPSEALLRFQMKAYAPRALPPTPAREPALPQSIKDAIVRWLDESL